MTFDEPGDPFEPNGDDGDIDARLDEDFPLGDGTAETEAMVDCPYCAAAVVIAIDPGGGAVQEYVEDCDVCCQPWVVSLTYRDGLASVTVRQLDG